MNDIVPTNTLAKQGVAAVGGIAGGLGLMIVGGLWWPLSVAIGAVVGFAGFSALSSADPADRFGGKVALAAGGLVVLSKLPIVGGLAGAMLGLGTLGLIGLGAWNAFKFFKGLKTRA